MDIKRPDLWNKVLYGISADALEAADILHENGEMSDFMFQTMFLGICYAESDAKSTKKRRKAIYES